MSRENVLHEDVDAARNGHFGVSWPIEKHCRAQDFGGLGKTVNCA